MKQVTPLRPTVAALVTVALTGAMAGGGDATRLTAAAGQASTASRDVSQAQLDRWKKELSNAAPLAIKGGTGSPLNPIAMF